MPAPPESGGTIERTFVGPGGWSASLLTNAHPKLQGVKAQFMDAWRHSSLNRPHVERVYQIRNPQHIYEAYQQYQLEAGGQELRRFHGTSQICNFGSDLGAAPCQDRRCAVCNICRESFDIKRSRTEESGGTPAMGLRFGDGIYLAPESSKSHSYNQGSQRDLSHGRYRVMFLCKVAAGERPFETQEAGLHHRAVCEIIEGERHTCIVGKVGPNLNYEEIVVYNNAAAIPSYLIVYQI